jgi:hypothetical protein
VNHQKASVALDIGTATVTAARDGADPATSDTPDGGWPAGLSAALAGLGSWPRRGGLCLAVPDAWLDGSVTGTTAQEEARHLAADGHGLGPLCWAGQLAAVAALTARDRGPGRYLICDIGASAVRVVSAQVDGPAQGDPADGGIPSGGHMVVTTLAAHHTDSGWRDFDASLRTRLAADGRRLPADWYEHATTEPEDHRARVALLRAAKDENFGDTRAYSIAGTDGAGIFAAELLACFAAIRSALTTGIAAVTRGRRPDVTVLTGGFGWFPPVAHTVAGATGTATAAGDAHGPLIKPATAAAEGALLFASGQVGQGPLPPLTATMPVHRVSGGLLETADLPLEWTSPFADVAGGPLHLEGDDLMLTINGSPTTVPLPGIKPGPHLIGIRRGWTGAAALVVRPVADGTPQVAALTSGGTR